MHIDSGQEWDAGYHRQLSLLQHLAGSGRAWRLILGLDMSAGRQPPVKPAVVNQQKAFAIGMKHNARTREVARGELVAGKGIGRKKQ